MCGIAGIADNDLSQQVLRMRLQRMTDAIRHRGPDEEGFFVTDGFALGMRRLSIIDVAGGQQPIANEDGNVQVVCNGEIYNYPELRKDLEARGHVFRTQSDVEVIAHLYEDKGTRCFEDLRGMLAVAVWDHRHRRLILARDRLGKKPLFYSLRDGRLIFGSEIKAILAADPDLADPDPSALVPYFRFGMVAQPDTMFRHIRKLPAAHFMTYEDDHVTIEPYWELTFGDDGASAGDARDYVEELDRLLEESVRIRLMSEVPLGVFLSGGLDSSTMVAYAHRAGLRPLRTFTVGFDRPEWDESQDAKLIADHFQTEHHELTLRESDMKRNLPETVLSLVRQFDEPFGDIAALPTYLVSKLAREHVTVIISGDGGDELFAGYSIFRGVKFAERYRSLPTWLGARVLPSVADFAAACLPAGSRYQALRVAKILHESSLPFEELYFSKMTGGGDRRLRQVFADGLIAELATQPRFPPHVEAVLRSDLSTVNKMSQAHMVFALLERYLVKTDRMSMANSLEVRSPLLDHRLVEFAARVPTNFKLRGWETKALLRDAVRSQLPPATLRKRKQGFGVPLRDWLRTSLDEMVGDYLESDSGRLPSELFNRSGVQKLLRQHRRGEADHSSLIWNLLNYAVWRELYQR